MKDVSTVVWKKPVVLAALALVAIVGLTACGGGDAKGEAA